MSQPSARSRLRDATAAAHQQAHRLAPFADIEAQRLTRAGYLRLLQALFLFHSAIAEAARQCGWRTVSSSAARLRLIYADLRHLGGEAPEWTVSLQLSSPLAVLGAAYVAEGSMIGNKLIARHLDYLLGAGPEGRRFFIGRGASDVAAWRHLLDVLELALHERPACDEAVQGALAAFALFETCVGRCGQTSGHEKPPLLVEAGVLRSRQLRLDSNVTSSG